MGKEKNGQSFCKKDKHAPRRPISAFFFYNQERREKLKKEKPELDNKEIIKTMSYEWKYLSDEKKEPYLIKANDDKKRYDAEKRAYDEKKKEYRDLIYNDVNNYLKCERRINKTINDKSTKIEQLFLVDNDLIFDSTINKSKDEEEELKIEINEINKNQNKTIIGLKNKLKKAYEIIENQSIIINDLKNKLNISNDKINYYKNEINNLENNIKKKEKELNDYKSYLESELNNINKTTKVDVKDIVCVNFISSDGNIHKAIPCVPNNTFAEIEEKLYQFFPEYRKFNNTFLAHGSPVLRFKTISENKIGDGFPVTLIFE